MRYEPDNSELSPDVLVSVSQLLPNSDGSYRAPYPAVASSYSATSFGTTNPQNAFLASKPDATRRLFVGTNSRIYEATGGSSWTDRSAGGAAYTTNAGWSFCQNGTDTLAANKQNVIQTSTAGAFAALGGAPKAHCIETLEDALLAWNVDDGTDRPDELWITDQGVLTTWTPATSNVAYQTQLTECPGDGTAMIRYRNFAVIFKRRGMWIAQFVGRPDIWDVKLFSADVGCVGKDACVVAEDVLYFADDKNVYAFDGATIRSITDPFHTKTVTQGLLNVTNANISRTFAHFDDINKIVSLYKFDNAGYWKGFYAYNTVARKWGYAESGPSNGDPGIYAIVRATIADLISFSGSGVAATDSENRYNVYLTTFPSYGLRNGHASDTAGAAVTAYFGDPFQAQTLGRVWGNSDNMTGVTVSASVKRSPRSSATTESSASAATFNADMFADIRCSGHFFKLTYAWTAQTAGTPADFRKWQGSEMNIARAGKK